MKNQIWGGKLASLPCPCISEAVCRFRWMLNSGLQIWAGGNAMSNYIWPSSRKIMKKCSSLNVSKCPSVKTGKENNFMLYRSCWRVLISKSATPNIPKPSLCSSSEAKASKKVTLQHKTGTKLLDSADMSWFGLLHFISEELATAWRRIKRNCAVPNVL